LNQAVVSLSQLIVTLRLGALGIMILQPLGKEPKLPYRKMSLNYSGVAPKPCSQISVHLCFTPAGGCKVIVPVFRFSSILKSFDPVKLAPANDSTFGTPQASGSSLSRMSYAAFYSLFESTEYASMMFLNIWSPGFDGSSATSG
jgi:hypothetical protein